MLFPLLALTTALAAQTPPSPAPPAPPELSVKIDRSTRLLVVAPHPDDETLGAAGLIQRVRTAGGAVRVLMMTSGDGFPEGVERAEGIAHPRASDFRNYGQARERETVGAMALLGLGPAQVTFLGFPDEGLCHLASTYLFDKTRAYQSPYSNRSSPPPTERLIRGATYRGIDVRREIENVITGFAPDLVVLPFSGDDHPDHCATHTFVHEAFEAVPASLTRRLRVLHYVVHLDQWPLADGVGARVSPPAGFSADYGRVVSLTLTVDEVAAKKRALLAYVTQMEVIGRFMMAFGRENELFVEGEPKEALSCWCDDGEDAAPPRRPAPPPRPRP